LAGLDRIMESNKPITQLKPLVVGRTTRILFGIGTFVLVAVIGPSNLTFWGTVALVVLGISFVIGGAVGNPGCELTAIPNLLLSKGKKIHCL
ncbi:MAG: hypothetical protein KAJ37_12615, partial [Candidatus Krumholzibacteria bacterium]|nr:hypothetical protein [Candidatus Krumholzibacteria bacterium]